MSIDDDIILKIKKGDVNSFEVLFEKYQYLVKNRIMKIIGNSPEVEDLVQEIFYKVFKNIGKYNFKKSKFSTWISTIAHNATIDFLKKQHMKIFSSDTFFSAEDSLDIPDDDDPQSIFINNEERKFLLFCMAKLPKKYFDILELRYMQDKSYNEISKILNIPMGTVMTRIFRAKRAILKIAEEENRK